MGKNKFYSDQDIEIINKYKSIKSNEEIGNLIGRTENAVRLKIQALRKPQKPRSFIEYTEKDINFIKANPKMKRSELAKKLGRKINSIDAQRRKIAKAKKQNTSCNFSNSIRFCADNNFRNIPEAIRYYKSSYAFKKAVEKSLIKEDAA